MTKQFKMSILYLEKPSCFLSLVEFRRAKSEEDRWSFRSLAVSEVEIGIFISSLKVEHRFMKPSRIKSSL